MNDRPKMYRMYRWSTLCAITISILLLMPACVSEKSKTKVVMIGLTHSKSHSFTQALERFKEQLEKTTQGRYQVKIFHSSQIGGEKEMQEMLTIGSLDLSVSGLLNMYEPLFSLFEMPYLYRSREHVYKVNNSKVMEEVADTLRSNGIVLVGFYENGFRDITNSVRPVRQPSDLEGLKIRTPENPAQIQTIKALGAIPTPMSYAELYTALLQGVVDGQENPLQNIWYGRLYEAQPHIAMTHHIYNSAYVIASRRFWDQLPESDQEIFKRCLNESSLWQLAYMEKLDRELEQKMKDHGVQFTYPDRKIFEMACQPAYEALYDRFGPEAKVVIEKIKAVE